MGEGAGGLCVCGGGGGGGGGDKIRKIEITAT